MTSRSPAPVAPLELVVFHWGAEPQRYRLPTSGQVRIGRDRKTNDITIVDSLISRNHAILHVGPNLHVEDLGSSNGTSLRKGDKDMDCTTTQHELRYYGQTFLVEPGDRIGFGSTRSILCQMLPNADQRAGAGGADQHPPVVHDPVMRALYGEVARVAQRLPTQACILILGDTGVGKEEVARALHNASPRAHKKCVTVNCPNLSESMFESAMFGHKKGAFTGATADAEGHFDMAQGGTLFLDEIGDLALVNQAKLLRVLEEYRMYRVGDPRPRPVDVRVIAATNQRLHERIAQGTFRADLYYRLCQSVFNIPPLKARPGDIVPLAQYWLARYCESIKDRRVPILSGEAMIALEAYHYPGNVRDVKNAMLHAAVHCDGPMVLAEHLPSYMRGVATPQFEQVRAPAMPEGLSKEARILEALRQTAGSHVRAAAYLGVSRSTFYNWLKEFPNIPRPRKDEMPVRAKI